LVSKGSIITISGIIISKCLRYGVPPTNSKKYLIVFTSTIFFKGLLTL